MSFVSFEYLRIVHIPGSLVSYEPQFVAILNGAHQGCQPGLSQRLNLRWNLNANVRRESGTAHDIAQTENG
jgi:hypothetical protein